MTKRKKPLEAIPTLSTHETAEADDDVERAAIQGEGHFELPPVDIDGDEYQTTGPMGKLPVFGEVVPKGANRLVLQSEAQRRSVEAAKTTAAERTLPLPLVQSISEAIDKDRKRRKKGDLVGDLTDSLRQAKMSESGETETIKTVSDSDTETTSDTKKEYMKMAAKKKSAAKKSRAPKAEKKAKIQTAAPIGRERKLLLRLSTEEYSALQAKAAKQETSMANLLRTSALG